MPDSQAESCGSHRPGRECRVRRASELGRPWDRSPGTIPTGVAVARIRRSGTGPGSYCPGLWGAR